jgi:hypothetical protein
MARQEGEVDQRQDIVDGIMVLGDAERPAELGAVGAGVSVGQLADRLGRDARFLLGILQRVGLDTGLVFLEVERRAFDEFAVLKPSREDLAADRVGQRDIGTDVQSQPAVGPLRRAGPAGIDDVELRAVLDPFQDMQEVDRMRLTRIRAPEDDQVGLL